MVFYTIASKYVHKGHHKILTLLVGKRGGHQKAYGNVCGWGVYHVKMYVSLFFGGKKIDRLALQDLRADDSFLTWICRITMTKHCDEALHRSNIFPLSHLPWIARFGLPGSNVFVFHFCFSFLFVACLKNAIFALQFLGKE